MTVLAGILRTEDFTPIIDIPITDSVIAVNALLAKYQEERNDAYNLFVEESTTAQKAKVRSAGVDEGQRLGPDGRPLETRPAGLVEVAFPWERFGWAFGANFETQAAMTVADLNASVVSITGGNAKRHSREMMRALYGNANYDHPEPDGTLTIRRLANSDGTLYAPNVNSDNEADDNHYLVSGYLTGAMSATNNPFATLATEIREHFATTEAIVAFINSAQRNDVLTLLPNFTDADVEGINRSALESSASALTGVNVPGDFLGVDGDSGVYVYVWDRTPATYIPGFAVGQPPPLRQRVPAIPILQGFKLEAEEEHNPLWKRTYRDRFGYGVANRLSAAIVQLKGAGTYDVPAAYA